MNRSLNKTNEFYASKEGYSYSDAQVDKWLKRWLTPYVTLFANSKILDLCCGDGVWSHGLLRLNPTLEITGVDISKSAIECARKRSDALGVSKNTHFLVKDMEKHFGFPSGYYDIIFARGLFIFNQHNMMRPATLKLLEYWHRLLNKKGIFYSSYGSKPELLGKYTPPHKTKLPLNFVPRKTPSVNFSGGKYNHTVNTFLKPYISIPSIQVKKSDFISGRHIVISSLQQETSKTKFVSVKTLFQPYCEDTTNSDIQQLDNTKLERPALTLIVPDKHFLVGEELNVQVFPPLKSRYEIEIRGSGIRKTEVLENNGLTIRDLSEGKYRFRTRYFQKCDKSSEIIASDWSLPLDVIYYKPRDISLVNKIRSFEHNLSLICEKDVNGVVLITDPNDRPPKCPDLDQIQWFKTPCYEGSTMLLNEESDYYRDPLKYYFDVLDNAAKDVNFITWDDLINDRYNRRKCNLLIQFDVDAGIKSIEKIIQELLSRNIRFSIMVHREAHGYYEYSINQMDIDLLKRAESSGCNIGYHNNTISNLHFCKNNLVYNSEILTEATERFRDDVLYLRNFFDIKIFTNHGGNSLNLKTPIPDDLDIMCVDKPFNYPLWKKINSSFSDGGFLARPCSFKHKVANCKSGVHFIRNHPVKYGNYSKPFDIIPSDLDDAVKTGLKTDEAFWKQFNHEMTKQRKWLLQRKQYRMAKRFSYSSVDKPISSAFTDYKVVEPAVEKLRSLRRPSFLRQYPSAKGDPRVFWWRMLDAFAPINGTILNVGALPPGQKEEMSAFLSPNVKVVDMDIDPSREPDLLIDITQVDTKYYNHFDAVLLFGLPYVHSPSKAVQSCLRLVKPRGIAIFGFASGTHPFRGGMWKPETRPLHRIGREPLTNIGLRGNLWSFDDVSVKELFPKSSNAVIEFFFHYWFVIIEKDINE